MEPPEAPEDGFDRTLWRAGQLLGLAIILVEVAYLANLATGGALMSQARAMGRRAGDRWRAEWMYVTAPLVARREAPFLVWQAWRHSIGESP